MGSFRIVAPIALALLFACGTEEPPGGGNMPGDAGGQVGRDATPPGEDAMVGPNPDAGSMDGDTGAAPDMGISVANPNDPNNHMKDSDCDGLSDAYEFATVYPNGMKTNPMNPDTDGDGLGDGLEHGVTRAVAGTSCTIAADQDPASTTSPVTADSDGDGIPDGLEDLDRNGRVDAGESNPRLRDSDGDGLPDGIEDANQNGRRDMGELDPSRADTDGDGISDGLEDANRNGAFEPGETNPLSMDTDGDGVNDGDEDTDHNGVRAAHEIDPRLIDTDCDGLSDGEELRVTMTNPLVLDSDRDGIPDGVELGRTGPLPGTNCPSFVGDADPATMTNPREADSDGDGLLDGAEDANRNGRADPGETNPANADSDGDGFSDGDEVLIGTNPLDPMSPDPNVGPGVTSICSDANLQPISFHGGGMGDWTLAVRPQVSYRQINVSSMDVHAATIDDPMNALAGFVVELPRFGAGGSAAEDTALGQRWAAGAMAANLALSVRQSARNITSHDGFPSAVSAVIDLTSRAQNAAETRNQLLELTTGLPASAFANLPAMTGPNRTAWALMYQVLVRPTRLIVVAGVLDRGQFDDQGDARGLHLADLTNGTAIARRDARRGKGCDPFTAQGQAIADFVWMADISGSTDDDRGRIVSAAQQVFDALQNNGVDFRMGVVPHTESTQHGRTGTLRGGGFTRDRATFAQHLQNTAGTDGCEYGLMAVDAAINRLLPRTPMENPQRLRDRATLAVVYVSDEHAQEIEQLGVCDDLPAMRGCPTGVQDVFSAGVGACNRATNAAQQTCVDNAVRPFITRIQNESGIAFGQVFAASPLGDCNTGHYRCPNSQQDRNEPGRGYIEVINATGGLFYSPCDANPGAGPLQAIVDAVTGAASEFRLRGAPIASTIKVGITRAMGGQVEIVPRDKLNGFDYDPASNSIFFRGSQFRPNRNERVTISYRVWGESVSPCGPCAANQVCDPVLAVCACDAAVCAACGPNSGCDANCNCACAANCNGNCGSGQVCNQQRCQCECPQDCGGCPAGTICNPQSCACECDANCGGACTGNLACNTQACNCQCPANCGGICGRANCNQSTCSCDCGPECNNGCPGRASCNPANNCQCECPADCGGCPDGTTCNPGACECQCPVGCGANCRNRQICDPNNSCQCVCPADCGGCAPNEICDPNNCACVPVV